MATTQKPAPPFNMATRPNWFRLGSIPYVANSPQNIQLPQVGLLADIIIPVTVTFTANAFTGTVTAGTGTQQTPWSLVKRLILRTNEGSELYNTSGMNNYIVQRNEGYTNYSNLNSPLGMTTTAQQLYVLPTIAASGGPYTVKFVLRIPVAWQHSLAAGLILLQNPTTRLTLEIQWGSVATDLYVSSDGSFNPTNVTVSTDPHMLVYNVPQDTRSFPDLSVLRVQLDDTQSITNSVFDYRPPLGNTFLNITQAFFNNSARLSPASINFFTLTYGQTQLAFTKSPAVVLYEQADMYGGNLLPDGVFKHTFDNNFGTPVMLGTRDVINTGQITDLNLQTTIASTVTLTNAYVSTVRDMLSVTAR